MIAAEKLIAKKGLKNVSIKEIVKAAGQKNESALQYHFKSLQGLIDAILDVRSEQTQARRAELLEALKSSNRAITLRDVCKIMIMPSYTLGRGNAEYRRFIVGFSHNLALSPNTLLTAGKRGAGGQSGRETRDLIQEHLPHLDADALHQRVESAVRLASISMGFHARQPNAFRGDDADLFLSNLLDAMVGLLSAPISDETRELTKKLQTKKSS
jgi:AcrR family transcriptional regulator